MVLSDFEKTFALERCHRADEQGPAHRVGVHRISQSSSHSGPLEKSTEVVTNERPDEVQVGSFCRAYDLAHVS
jgi:hypothetical protein